MIDWRRFYQFNTPPGTPGFTLNLSRKIDPFLVPAQPHLAFRKFHNKVVDTCRQAEPASRRPAAARKTVMWHYQWMVLHGYVERLTEDGIVAKPA
jgi:hypothetical protein